MALECSRRRWLNQSLHAAGAATLATEGGRGYGAPLSRKLSLKIRNPEAAVLDAKMPTPKGTGNEFPPSVVTAAGRRWLFIGNNHSVAVPIPVDGHILKDPSLAVQQPPIYSIGGVVHEIRLGRLPFLYNIPDDVFWRHTYCGAFNVDVMPEGNGHTEWIFSINHCENKNLSWRTKYTKIFTTNSINPADEATATTTSGNFTGRFRDYQPAYFGLVSMSYAPIAPETKYGAELFHHDMGPVTWPQTGFMTPDGKLKAPGYNNPHPHPSSLIAEDPRDGRKYVYLFEVIADPENSTSMIGAARSPLAERGLPGTYMNFYRGEYTEPSLPDMSGGIVQSRCRKGGRASAIHPSTSCHMNRFFVARLKRSGLFLSVETYTIRDGSESYMETALRLSEDLRNWTDRFAVPNTRVNSGQKRGESGPFNMYYPKFLSGDGSSHYLIDESERFYILATKPHETVYRELSIEVG